MYAPWIAHLLHRKMYACRVSSDRPVPRDPSPSVCTTSTPVGSPVKWAQGSPTAKGRAAVEEAPAVDVSYNCKMVGTVSCHVTVPLEIARALCNGRIVRLIRAY